MYFEREGIPFILLALTLSVAGFVLALMRRSWPLWLLAFVLTLCTLWVSYSYRVSSRAVAVSTVLAELPR